MPFDPVTGAEKAESLDAISFFKKQMLEVSAPERGRGVDAKYQPELDALDQAAATAQKLREEKARREDNILGITDRDIINGGPMQLLASLVGGTDRVISETAAAPFTIAAEGNLQNVDDRARELYAREQQGETLAPEDLEYLEAAPEKLSRTTGMPVSGGDSRRQLIEAAEGKLDYAGRIRENQESRTWSNSYNRDELSKDLKTSYAEHSARFEAADADLDSGNFGSALVNAGIGVAGLVVESLGDIVENPAAIFEYVAENAPQLAVGAVSKSMLAVTNAAYGSRIYEQALADYREQNEGALPSQGEAAAMLGWSITASAAEQVADVSILNTFKRVPGATKAVENVLEGVTGKIINNGITRTAAAGTAGTAREAATEVYQTAVEEGFSKLSTDIEGEKLFEAGVIGGASGGSLSTVGKGFAEVRQALSQTTRKNLQGRLDTKKVDTLMGEALETGDVSALTDRTKPDTFRPAAAAVALLTRAENPELSEEVRSESKAAFEELIETQKKAVSGAQAFYNERDPQKISQLKETLEKDRDSLEQAEIELLEQVVKEAEADGKKAVRKAEQNLAYETALLNELDEVRRQGIAKQTGPVDEAVQAVESGEVASMQVAIDAMIADPESVSEEQIATLEAKASPEQAKYLRAFTQTQAAANALRGLEGVREDIMQGRVGFKGITEYLRDVGNHLGKDRADLAEAELRQLQAFQTDHQAKFDALTAAREAATERGVKTFVVKDYSKERGWRVTTTRPKNFARSLNGGFIVNPTTKGLAATDRTLEKIGLENQALDGAANQIQETLALRGSETRAAEPQSVEEPPEITEADIPPTPEEVAAEPEQTTEEAPAETEAETAPEPEAETAEEPAAQEPSVDEELTNLLAEETETTTDDEVEVEDGRNPAFEQQEPVQGNLSQDNFFKTNLVGAYFTQQGDTNPLVAIKDFMAVLFTGGELQADILTENGFFSEDLSPEQTGYLQTFGKFLDFVDSDINLNITDAKINAGYEFRDYVHFLGSEQNVRAGIALAAYTWLAENGGPYQSNDERALRAIFHLKEFDDVEPGMWDFADAGSRENLVVQELGKKAAQALGLRARKDAPANSQAQLELSLGAHALAILQQGQFVERNLIKSEILPDELNTNAAGSPFIRISQPNGEVSARVQKIYDAAKNTESVMTKVFGVENELVEPDLEPGQFDQTTIKRTRQGIPKPLAAVAKAVSKRKHRIRQDMMGLASALDRNTLLKIGGAKLDMGMIHSENQKSQQAVNDQVARDLDRLTTFAERVGDKPFFFSPKIWSVQRAGLAANAVNPQSSKVQRHFLSMHSHRVSFAVGEPSDVRNRFLLAVAQGLGIDVDKQLNVDSLDELRRTLSQDNYKAAITALRRVNTLSEGETLSAEEQEAIASIASGEKNFHTLDALLNYANFLELAKAGDPSAEFTTDLMFEVDGVTNGPALAHVLLGHANRYGRQFGMFNENDEYSVFTQYKGDGNLDIYETVAAAATGVLARLGATERAAIYHFTGDLTDKGNSVTGKARKLVKQPLTSMVFGAGVATAIDNMAAAFVQDFYGKLEEQAPKGVGAVNQTIQFFNDMMPANQQVAEVQSIEEAMQIKLSPRQKEIAEEAFRNTVGYGVETALKANFQGFIDTRTTLNQGAQAIYARYKIAFEHLKQKRINELVKSGDLPVDQAGVPLQDLSETELDQIRETLKPIAPHVHTAYSKLEGNLDNGIDVTKVADRFSDDKAYSAEVKFGQDLPDSTGKARNKKLRAMEQELGDPGVRAVIMMVHALDSYIASQAYSEIEALNIHDALGLSLTDTEAGAQALNRATFRGLAGYSLPMEILAAVDRSFDGLNELDPELAAELAPLLSKAEIGQKKKQPVDESLRDDIRLTATAAELSKLSFLQGLKVVDQYALEGGSYEVTADDKALLAKKEAALRGKQPVAPASKELEIIEDNTRDTANPQVWGAVWTRGEPKRTPNPALVAALESGKANNLKTLVPVLRKAIAEQTRLAPKHRAFQIQLLDTIAKLGDPELPIRYLKADTPITPEERQVLSQARGANGWFVSGRSTQITVRGAEFAGSSMDSELLLHELVHSVTSETINRLEGADRSKLTPNEQARFDAIEELETLRVRAQEYAQANDLDWDYATSNVKELIAYGMSDPTFQNEVLSKITLENATAGQRSQQSGMRAFIRSMVKLVFASKVSESATNGLGVMIANTAFIMEDARGAQDTQLGLDLMPADTQTFTSAQVYEALGQQQDLAYDRHLKGVLEKIVGAVYGAYGSLRLEAEQQAQVSAEDSFLQALADGKAPFGSRAQAFLRVSDQEAYVLESAEITARESIDSSRLAQRETRRLFNTAKEALDAKDLYQGDWTLASREEREAVEAAYDFIFTPKTGTNGKSEYLAQFLATSLAYKPLRDALQQVAVAPSERVGEERNLGDKITNFFLMLMDKIAFRFTRTYEGQSADQATVALAYGLAKIERKRRDRLERLKDKPETVLEASARKATEKAKAGVEKAANSRFFKENRSKTVSAIGSITATIAGDRAEQFLDAAQRLRDGVSRERLGVVGETFNEIRGERDSNSFAHQLLATANMLEQARKQMMIDTKQFVNDSYAEELSETQKEAITRVLLRSDVATLTEHYSLAELEEMLRDKRALKRAQRDWEQKLNGNSRNYYLMQSKGLGYFLATGKVRVENLMMNARNIAYLGNTGRTPDNAEAQPAVEAIDALASLYALQHVSPEQKLTVSNIMRREAQREEGNGIDLTLRLHKQLQKEARETLFVGNEFNLMKGYTTDIYNPYISVKAATALEGAQLEKAGYVRVYDKPIGKDPADPDKEPKWLYSIRDGGLNPTVTGFMSSRSRNSRGTTIHFGESIPFSEDASAKNEGLNRRVEAQKNAAIDEMFRSNGEMFDPSKINDKANRLVPLLNAQGRATNYRYMMEEGTKDALLERRNSMDEVLGHMAGSTLDKKEAPIQNRRAVDALYTQYRDEYATNPNAFIRVDANSPDPKVREQWNLLPEETKQYIQDTFGMKGMLVKSETYNIAFGYRKFSLGDMFERHPMTHNYLEKVMVWFLGQVEITKPDGSRGFIGSKRALRLVQAENMWQEIVTAVKDIWVIKNLFTLIGNEMSNFSVLILAGVPIKDIISNKITAYTSTLSYRSDRRERDALKRQIETGYITGTAKTEAEARIVELEDALARNPVADLVDAGMFQTLVEDIGQELDPYSYKSRMDRWTDAKTSWVPSPVKTVGRTLLMTHDTPFYKLMNQATILSDFTSRHVLYQQLTKRPVNPLDKESALRRTRAAFVNYDIPTHRAVQYLNDTGLLFFTKYYLRIQAVLLEMTRENPLRALMVLASFDWLFQLPDILDSSFLEKWPGNLGAGAAELPGAIDEIITLRTLGL